MKNLQAQAKFFVVSLTYGCVNYGQRVQNSVFECVLDAAQYRQVQAKLIQIADLERDSLRFYMLGNNYKSKVEHFEIKPSYEAEGVLMV